MKAIARSFGVARSNLLAPRQARRKRLLDVHEDQVVFVWLITRKGVNLYSSRPGERDEPAGRGGFSNQQLEEAMARSATPGPSTDHVAA